MGPAVRTILTIVSGLVGAATLAFVILCVGQGEAVRALLVQQAASRERGDSEMRRGLSRLAERMDSIEAELSRELAAGNTGTQASLRRLQRRFADDINSVRGNLADMGAILERPAPAEDPLRAMTAGVEARAAGAATGDIAAASPEPVERDLALAHALQRATELFDKRQFAEAARILTPFTSQSAAVPELRLYSAASRFYANKSDSSVQAAVERDLKVVLKTEPENLTALEAMGSLCLEQGRWIEALDLLSHVILFKPTDADVREKAGTCAQAVGDLPQARAHFDAAAALRPGDAQLWYAAGNACAGAGQHDEALVRFQKCLSLQPRHYGARVGATHCLNELGRSEEATALGEKKE